MFQRSDTKNKVSDSCRKKERRAETRQSAEERLGGKERGSEAPPGCAGQSAEMTLANWMGRAVTGATITWFPRQDEAYAQRSSCGRPGFVMMGRGDA